jgi:uncharacterized peroxidase-related enzyme
MQVMGAVAGGEPDDVIKTSLYRPEFFGRAWIALLRAVMRGPSDWSPGERELFAAFVSRLNTCRFCVGIHTNTTRLTLDPSLTQEKLDHWREAGFAPRIAATLALLEKTTLFPDDVSAEDIDRLRAEGVSENAIVDALQVGFIFNVVNRLANALDFDYGTEVDAFKTATILNRLGYQLPGFLLR